uniref:hypothetical protein n=1 Tax=Xanthomonas graminis TaxID=3390026 RepID=UPI001C3037E5
MIVLDLLGGLCAASLVIAHSALLRATGNSSRRLVDLVDSRLCVLRQEADSISLTDRNVRLRWKIASIDLKMTMLRAANKTLEVAV